MFRRVSFAGRFLVCRRRSTYWVAVVAVMIVASFGLFSAEVRAHPDAFIAPSVASDFSPHDDQAFSRLVVAPLEAVDMDNCGGRTEGVDGTLCIHASCGGIAGIDIADSAPAIDRDPTCGPPRGQPALRAGEPDPDLQPPRRIS